MTINKAEIHNIFKDFSDPALQDKQSLQGLCYISNLVAMVNKKDMKFKYSTNPLEESARKLFAEIEGGQSKKLLNLVQKIKKYMNDIFTQDKNMKLHVLNEMAIDFEVFQRDKKIADPEVQKNLSAFLGFTNNHYHTTQQEYQKLSEFVGGQRENQEKRIARNLKKRSATEQLQV